MIPINSLGLIIFIMFLIFSAVGKRKRPTTRGTGQPWDEARRRQAPWIPPGSVQGPDPFDLPAENGFPEDELSAEFDLRPESVWQEGSAQPEQQEAVPAVQAASIEEAVRGTAPQKAGDTDQPDFSWLTQPEAVFRGIIMQEILQRPGGGHRAGRR